MRVNRILVIAGAVLAAMIWLAALSRGATSETAEPVIHITAERFAFKPEVIHLKRSMPVVLELTTLDRRHGFKSTLLGLRADIIPGQTARIRLVPKQAGTFAFHCDVFCGSGHEDMSGTIVVE
jgi:cytochrome c oxidase subunit II